MARPRKFDEDTVVAEAMLLFWEKGFEGTSLDALEECTGLNRSSLYSTFGGKVDLFCKSLDAYSNGPCRDLFQPFRELRGAAAINGYLQGLQMFLSSKSGANGCLMVNTKLELLREKPVGQRLDSHFKTLRALIIKAYRAGLADGTLNSALSPEDAADWLLTFVRGLLAGAASGERRSVLVHTITTTIKQMNPNQP